MAEITTKRGEGVTVDVSCPGYKGTERLAPYKTQVAEIALDEVVAATLLRRPLDQANVDAAFAKLDLSGLDKTDITKLRSQSQFGDEARDIGAENTERTREQYADHFNSSGDGDGGWGADAAYNAGEE